MLENPLLKTHFIGRDGYVWWIGQIPKQKNWIDNIAERPTESNDEFKGFDYRYKVRIIGYHPPEVEELSDEDLPWATVLFPVTAGSGQGGASQSPNLRQGMFVHGFFLDGEDAQQPVITGVFGVNQYAEIERNMGPLGPFKLFSGHDSTDSSNPVSRSCLPANQDQSNTDGVVIESTIAQDQDVCGPDAESDADDKIPQENDKSPECDLDRKDNIQTILKNALNRKQRLEKAKKDWKKKISTTTDGLKIDVTGALKGISNIEKEIDKLQKKLQLKFELKIFSLVNLKCLNLKEFLKKKLLRQSME